MSEAAAKQPIQVAKWSELEDRKPAYALVGDVDLVVIRYDDSVSVLYGRCLHRGALLADSSVDDHDNLICGLHVWDYRVDTGVSAYNNREVLTKFSAWVEGDSVFVDGGEVAAFTQKHPQPYDRKVYLGLYQDPHGTPQEPYNGHIQELAQNGLSSVGHHGETSAMGVALTELPRWKDIQLLTA